MAVIFIPTDRIGLYSFQKSIGNMARVINNLLELEYPVGWHFGGLQFERTALWPEGRFYQCGYSLKDSKGAREILDMNKIVYDQVETVPVKALMLSHSKIAVYNGSGAGAEFSGPLLEVLDWGGFCHEYISDQEIRDGRLMEYDIFLVPGSPDAGECYYLGLGEKGFEEIRKFLAEKGQYMGICGGAYLPLSSGSRENPYWLNIMEATEDQDLDYWHTGSGFVRCRIDEPDHPLFAGIAAGRTTSMNMVYWEGPCIHILGGNIRQLGHFESLLANGLEKKPYWDLFDNNMAREAVEQYYNPVTEEEFERLMKGKTSFAEGDYRGHKVLMISPHPEMGNIGYGPREDSLNFLLVYNGLFYLGAQI